MTTRVTFTGLLAAFVLLLGAEAAQAQTAPTVTRATLLTDNKVRVTFNKVIDRTSRPAGSAFRVVSKIFNHREQTHVGTGTVAISFNSVTVTLDSSSRLSTAADFTVTYTKPASNPLRGNDGVEVAGFSRTHNPSAQGWEAYSIECRPFDSNYLGGYWYMTYKYGFGQGDRWIACDMAKPAAINDPRANRRGHIMWVYAGHPGTWADNPAPPVNQPHAAVTYLVPGQPDHRAVRGTDGECYREERTGGRWHRSVSYGSDDEACRKAAWNTYHRAYWRPMVDLAGGPDAGTFPSGSPPVAAAFESAAVFGTTLTLTFDQNLKTGTPPAPGAFRVTVNNARRNVASGGVAIAGKTVTLTLASAVATDDTVRVRYTKPSSNPLRGANGLAVETFADQEVSAPETIWSATLTAGLAISGAQLTGCQNGQSVQCTSALTEDSFTLGDTTYGVETVYTSVDRASRVVLVFTLDKAIPRDWSLYVGNRQLTVANATLASNDKSATWSGALESLWTVNQQVQLRLTTGGSGTSDGSGGSGALGGEPPWVTAVSVASDAGADKTYALGDTIRVRVDFVEPVEVTGTPRFKIDMDPADWGEKWAAYESGSGTGTLVFAHTVVEPNFSSQGIAVLENTLELNGGTVRVGGADANLAHDGLGHDASHKVDWQTQPESAGPVGTSVASVDSEDSGPATVTGVQVVSDPGADDTYMLGDTIRIRASFSAAVNVTGSPRLSIDMSPAAWGTKQAAYASGGGTKSLTFAYTVVEPNFSPQGIAVLANSLALNGGTIRSAATNANAELAHSGLGHDSGHKVDWRPEVSVADARATEAAGATVAFQVSLSRAFTTAAHRVTVDYATADGTAKAGADYTATSGTLTFAAGETSKTVNVPILDDSHDEGEETFVLRLSNASGARIGDGEATGTIVNADPAQKAWIARLGRTVADQVIGAVDARMAAPRTAGNEVTLGGQRIALDAPADGGAAGDAEAAAAERNLASWLRHADSGSGSAGSGLRSGWAGDPQAGNRHALSGQGMTERELLLGSSFSLAAGDARTGSYGLWGRGSVSRFDGREGGLTVDGEVASAFLGADWSRERTTLGLMLGHSIGDGGYRSESGRGTVSSTLTGLYPWVRQALGERISLWGVAGYGEGTLTVTPANADGTSQAAIRTDLELAMGAVGLRGTLVQAPAEGGFELAVKTDAMGVRTRSAAVPGLAGTSTEVTRLRLGLEGSRPLRFEGGAQLRPSVEVAVRQDGGDAETGFGVDLGGGIAWTDPQRGLSVDLRGRGLVSHDSKGFREAGLSGSLSWEPRAESGRGPSLTLTQTMGGQAAGGADALLGRGTLAGLAANDNGAEDGLLSRRRLDVRFGYGFAAFGDRFTATPELGFGLSEWSRDYRLGWRLSSGGGAGSLDLSLEAARREAANGNGAGAGANPEHTVGLRIEARF